METNESSGIASVGSLKGAHLLSALQVGLIVVAAVPGVFVNGFYHDVPKIVATDRGTDLLALVVIAPALAISLIFSARGSLRAQLVWLGITSWTAYNYAVYAYGLNFTPMFVVYIGVFGLAVFTLVIAIRKADTTGIQERFKFVPRRLTAGYLWLVAGIFSILWLSDVLPATFGATIPPALRDLGTTSNPVEVNDLGIIIPTLILGGVWLWARRPAGYVLAGVLLGLATVTMTAVVPGGPVFGGQAVDPIYAGVAVLSILVFATFLARIRPALASPDHAAGQVTRAATAG